MIGGGGCREALEERYAIE
ncbi:hypothetical protein A2U01_0048098, partial [Trifolium medium]|nr:hypothetical protein [Trifolium medium]